MPFEIPSFDEIRSLLIASFVGRFPTKNVNKHGGLYKRLSVVALGILDNHYHLRQVGLDVMPDTAESEQLDRHAAIWGVPRKGATGAAKTAGLRVFGTVGATVPTLEPMVHAASGLLFETSSTGLIAASGYLDVDVTATSTGTKTNLEPGEELQFQSTPAGLESNARIELELENGLDQESDPDLRDRLLNRIGQPNAGGNANDFEQWILESENSVASGFVFPNRNGPGSVDLAGLKAGSSSARLLDLAERDTVFGYIDPIRPVTATIRVLEVTTADTDVDVVILPESGTAYAFDWLDSAVPVVSAYTPSTRLVELTAARPISMSAGDRVVFADPLLAGKQWTIESLSGTDDFIITEDAGAIAAGDVYSGGPLTDTLRDTVQALFDGLGPTNPDANQYGTWEANLRHSNLFEVVQTTTGVLDSQIVAPVASTTEPADPAYPSNDTVELLVARSIIIRSYASEGL